MCLKKKRKRSIKEALLPCLKVFCLLHTKSQANIRAATMMPVGEKKDYADCVCGRKKEYA